MKTAERKTIMAIFGVAIVTLLAVFPKMATGQCPACLDVPPPDIPPVETPIVYGIQNSLPSDANSENGNIEGATSRDSIYQAPGEPRRFYASIFVSAPVSSRFEVAALTDFPVEFPQVFVIGRLRGESPRFPTVYGGISSAFALNDFTTRGLFSAKHTAFWGQATKTFRVRFPVQVSVGAQKTWSAASVTIFGSVVFSPSSWAQIRGSQVDGAFYPGLAIRPYREWWIRTTYLPERKAVALKLLWQSTPSFDL